MLRRPLSVPDAVPLGDVMRDSPALGRLAQRLRESNAMFAAVAGLFPAGLAASVRPGPIDEEGWSLLCANAAVAAKLRHLVPRLEARLRDKGHVGAATIRIKVLPA